MKSVLSGSQVPAARPLPNAKTPLGTGHRLKRKSASGSKAEAHGPAGGGWRLAAPITGGVLLARRRHSQDGAALRKPAFGGYYSLWTSTTYQHGADVLLTVSRLSSGGDMVLR